MSHSHVQEEALTLLEELPVSKHFDGGQYLRGEGFVHFNHIHVTESQAWAPHA